MDCHRQNVGKAKKHSAYESEGEKRRLQIQMPFQSHTVTAEAWFHRLAGFCECIRMFGNGAFDTLYAQRMMARQIWTFFSDDGQLNESLVSLRKSTVCGYIENIVANWTFSVYLFIQLAVIWTKTSDWPIYRALCVRTHRRSRCYCHFKRLSTFSQTMQSENNSMHIAVRTNYIWLFQHAVYTTMYTALF